MPGDPVHVTFVAGWKVGFSKSTGHALLMFEWTDKAPVNLAMERAEAKRFAEAILAQLQQFPADPRQQN
jgi:hypothetical protein